MARSKFVVVLLLAALTLLPMSASAAEPDWPGADLSVTTEITPETPYTSQDVSDRAAHLGVSLEEADLRLQLERASVGLEPKLIEAFPETFGGVWLEAEGAPGLTVALTDGAEAALPLVQSMFAVPDAVYTITVEHSLADLLALQEEILADRTALQAGEAAGIHELATTAGNYDLDVDVQRNTVVVHLEDPTDALASAFAELYGSSMLVVEGDRASPHCTRADCRYTLRGGLRVENSAGGTDCSSGFTAVSGSNYYLLSAAHCTGTARYQGGERYGTVTLEEQEGYVDAERHYRSWPSPWYVSASIFVESNDIRPVYYHISWASTMTNTYVGKSGEETGTTRGHITSKHYAPWWVTNSSRFLKAGYCTEGGDSGGSVFNTNTAYGINSGGLLTQCPNSNAYGIFGNIGYAKDALGVSILASP